MGLAPQLHSRPQQEELSLSGITMALLGPLSHPPNAESFGIGASNMGAPGPPVKDPSFTRQAQILQYSQTVPVFSMC